VPSFKNFWSEDLAEGEVPAPVAAEAQASEEATLAEAQAKEEASDLPVSVEVEAEAPILVEREATVDAEAIADVSAQAEASAVVNAPAFEPVLRETDVEVPTGTEAVADEYVTEMNQGDNVEEPTIEVAATSAKVNEEADITADLEPEKNMPADNTMVEAPVVERSTAPEPSVGEAEITTVSVPPAEQESQPNETESNAPAEEQPTPSPVSVEDVPENNTNTVAVTESKKLDNAPSESMFDVDFSELASAKEAPLNNADVTDGDNKKDNKMDSATLAALALSAESTDEQDHAKEIPTIVSDSTEVDDAVKEKSANEVKSIKSTKSGKSAGNEEEEDIYDVDF